MLVFGILAIVSYAIYNKYYAPEFDTEYEPFTKGYSLEGVIIRNSNESGEITSTIESPSMIHYADTELSEIKSPKYTMHQSDGDWVFTSVVGEINKGQTTIYFPELVDLSFDSETTEAVAIQTSQLTIDLNEKTGVTDSKISVKRPGLFLTGLGSVINFTDQSIEILEDMYAEFEN